MFPSGEDWDDVPEPERKPMRGIFIGCWAAPIDTFARNKVASCSLMKTFLFIEFLFSYQLLPTSPNHLVRPHQHVRRNRQADLLGRFQINDEFKLLRLLHRQIGGLSAFQNLVHIGSGAAV
jgi:hypothetical protein